MYIKNPLAGLIRMKSTNSNKLLDPQEEWMTRSRYRSAVIVATTIALTSSVSSLALAQAQDTTRGIAKNESIFIDGKALTITQGTAKDDVSPQVAKLGARDVGPGAIIFRANDKLYIVDAPPLPLALNDRQQSYGGLNDRQQSYGGLVDTDYVNYRLKKTFQDVWGTAATDKK